MKRNYIGLANSFHDSAIAIVDDRGEVLFAEATERYLQYKRSIGVAPDLFLRTSQLIHEHCEKGAELVLAKTWSDETPALMQQGLEKITQTLQIYNDAFGETPWETRKQLMGQSFFFQSQLAMVRHPGHLLEYDLSQVNDPVFRQLQHRTYDHHLTY